MQQCSGSNVSEHGDVLVLANGSEEEPGFWAVHHVACARARKESPGKRKCARIRLHVGTYFSGHFLADVTVERI